MSSFSPFPDGPILKSIAPKLCDELATGLINLGRPEVAVELEQLTVPLQQIAGDQSSFSCMAYAEPRLSYDERQEIELRDPESLRVECSGGVIVLDLDDFGKVNWLRISNMPSLYILLVRCLDELRATPPRERSGD